MSTRIAEVGRPGVQNTRRTPVEKVAILLASLDNELAVELLKKLGSEDVKNIVESSAGLGSLTFSDVNPLVDEFAQEFAEALGISASREQLMALLEAAFSSDEIASFLGRPSAKPSVFSWNRFSMGMQGAIVPYILDEHPQTAAVVLSKLNPDLAARSIEILPSGLRASITAKMLKIGEIQKTSHGDTGENTARGLAGGESCPQVETKESSNWLQLSTVWIAIKLKPYWRISLA